MGRNSQIGISNECIGIYRCFRAEYFGSYRVKPRIFVGPCSVVECSFFRQFSYFDECSSGFHWTDIAVCIGPCNVIECSFFPQFNYFDECSSGFHWTDIAACIGPCNVVGYASL